MRIFLLLFLLPSLLFSAPNYEEHIKFKKEGPNLVGYLYIGDHKNTINQGTWIYVKNALDHYRQIRPSFILLELDSPGGEVFAAQKISDALKEFDIQENIPVVAFINNWAISAGAMLAYSCRYIEIVKDASMGAAEPITGSGEKTTEKVKSALRADFAGRAAFFDRNPLIAEAMVDSDLLIVKREGKIIQLEKEEQIKPGDQIINRKGKLLTLNAQEMVELGVADGLLSPAKLDPITQEERAKGAWPASKMLLFQNPFFKSIPDAQIEAFPIDWKTKFFSFLAHPMVASLLLLGLMVSFYVEINTGGFGAAAIFGLICLGLIVLSSFAVEAASFLELIILLVGVALILLEVFVLPSFGLLGVLGILLTIVGLGTLLLPGVKDFHFDFDTKTLNLAGEFVLERLAWFSGTFILGIVVILILARTITPKLHLFSPLVLRKTQTGYGSESAGFLVPKIGAVGTAVAPLRPAGKVEIEKVVYDALSDGAFIEKGVAVRVVEIRGSKILVEALL